MKYLITIKEKTIEEFTESTYEKVADTGNEKDGRSIYDYVKHPSTRTIEREVFSQEIDDLDLVEVIKAVNKIK